MRLPPDPRAPIAVLVLGMHRSGTSATAGSLRVLGVDLGERLIAGADDNRKGYWEHADAVAIHDRLLLALGRSWDDVRTLPADWQASAAAQQASTGIAAIVAGFSGSPLWAVKDPRMSRLAPLWLREIDRAGQHAACLIVLRHPAEVAASLAVRDGLPAAAAHLLWIRHVLAAIADSTGRVRCLVGFDALLRDPVATLDAVARDLGLTWPVSPAAAAIALAAFVDGAEKNQTFDADSSKTDPSRFAAFSERLYRRCVQVMHGEAAWDDLHEFVVAAADLERDESVLIQTVGQLQHSAARALAGGRLAMEVAALRDNVHALESAKSVAEALAHSRLEAMVALEQRYAQAEQLALAREASLQAAVPATAKMEALLLARLDENTALTAALKDAQALAYQRLDELTQAAAANALLEGVAIARLDELQSLSRALDEIRAQVVSRDAQVQQMIQQKTALEDVLAALRRELADLSTRLQQATQAIHDGAGREQVLQQGLAAANRREEIAQTSLNDALGREDATRQRLDEVVAANLALSNDATALTAKLAEITGSVAWRATTPLRRLSRRFGPDGKSS